MKKKRQSTEQVKQILRKADGEKTVEELCRESNIKEQTFYRWRRKYGRTKMADLKRFKELEKKNSQLKKMLADEMLKIRVLEETLKRSGERPCQAAGSAEDCPERVVFGERSLPIFGV